MKYTLHRIPPLTLLKDKVAIRLAEKSGNLLFGYRLYRKGMIIQGERLYRFLFRVKGDLPLFQDGEVSLNGFTIF